MKKLLVTALAGLFAVVSMAFAADETNTAGNAMSSNAPSKSIVRKSKKQKKHKKKGKGKKSAEGGAPAAPAEPAAPGAPAGNP